MDEILRNSLITQYHQDGYAYHEIISLLSCRHKIQLSLRSLKRILLSLNLKRRNVIPSPLEDVCTAIIRELDGAGCCLGYKSLWKRIVKSYGLKVKRATVEQVLQLADPEGIAARSKNKLRRRKYIVPGPNFLWHVDGYDKLKPFGFAIHGCIDGYSRKVLWLKVGPSNNKPEIIANYFLKTVQHVGFVPTLIRSDKGTENTVLESLQKSFRMDHDDKLSGQKSFISGKSTSNQRIEAYWSQMRKLGGDFWISFFKDMRDRCLFNDSDKVHVECLRYTFGPLLEADLELIKTEWNRHSIRKQKNRELPSGKPNCLFYAPGDNVKDYKKLVNENAVMACINIYSQESVLFRPEFHELVTLLIPGYVPPNSVDEALKMYITIIDKLA